MEETYKKLTNGVRKPTKNKIGVFVCGGSGAGKTMNRQKYIKDIGLRTSYVLLNVDDLREYFKYEESRTIFIELVPKVIEDGYSFYYEGTCRYPSKSLIEMKFAKDHGYSLKLIIVYADLDTVVERIKERMNQSTPPGFGKKVFYQLKAHAESYMRYDLFDEIFLYNNQGTSKMIFHKGKKTIECISPESEFYFDVSKYC